VIAAAGDIACERPLDGSTYNFNDGLGRDKVCRQEWTAQLIEQIDPQRRADARRRPVRDGDGVEARGLLQPELGTFLSKDVGHSGRQPRPLRGGDAFYDYFGERVGPEAYSS